MGEDGWVPVQPSGGEKDSWERAAQEQEAEIRHAKDTSAKPQERAQSRDAKAPRSGASQPVIFFDSAVDL